MTFKSLKSSMRSSDRTVWLPRIPREYPGSTGEEKAIIWFGTTQLRSDGFKIDSKAAGLKLLLLYQFSWEARSIAFKQSTTVKGKSSGPTPASLKVLNELRNRDPKVSLIWLIVHLLFMIRKVPTRKTLFAYVLKPGSLWCTIVFWFLINPSSCMIYLWTKLSVSGPKSLL